MVIIGGVAGGATAAARIRRLDEQAEIVVLERSGFISYANCGLPYYIGGVIQDQEELTLQTPQGFWDRFRIDVRVRHEATAIHREEKTVTVKNLETGEVTTESYDKLILAPGARPTRPPIPGLDSDRLFSLRTVEDTLAIRAFVEREKPRTRRAGRGRLHQPGAGGKPGRDGGSGDHCPAHPPGDAQPGLRHGHLPSRSPAAEGDDPPPGGPQWQASARRGRPSPPWWRAGPISRRTWPSWRWG